MSKRKRIDSSISDADSNPILWNAEVKEPTNWRGDLVLHLNALILDDELGNVASSINPSASFRSVGYLVDALTSGATNDGGEDETLARVALSMLSWAIKRLANHRRPSAGSGTFLVVVVRALEACLVYLHDKKCPNIVNQTHRILTQSTLLKILPAVAQLASLKSNVTDCGVISVDTDTDRPQSRLVQETENTDHASHVGGESGSDLRNETFPSTHRPRANAASTFQLLLTFFRPTLDVAFKSILIPIVDAMELHLWQTTKQCAPEKLPASDSCEKLVLLATLQWIGILYATGKGNPRTTFQLLSSPSVLLAVLRCYLFFDEEKDQAGLLICDKTWNSIENSSLVLIQGLLDDGLFSPVKHMDGFRSLLLTHRNGVMHGRPSDPADDAPLFRCYQEDLFVALASSPTGSDDGLDVQLHDARDLAVAVPFLFQRFMTNTKVWEERQTQTDQKLLKPEDFVGFQFQMFHRMTIPLRTLVTNSASCRRESISTIAVHSLVSCLCILLDHKGYLPTYDDLQRSQFGVLEEITQELLGCQDRDGNQDVQLLAAIVTGIHTLFALDHRLLRDNLASVYSICLRSEDHTLQVRVTTLLESLSDTFRLLRQQSHLFQSLIQFSNDLSEEKMGLLLSQLEHPSVVDHLARAIRDSPDLQMRNLFDLVYEMAMVLVNAGNAMKACDLSPVMFLSRLLVTHVRIDNATAMELASASLTFLDGPISSLLHSGGQDGTVMQALTRRASLYLCGLFLQLHTRCSYFLGSAALLPLPAAFSSFLEASTSRLDFQDGQVMNYDQSGLEEFADEWMILFCHRIHQIHSQIQRMELLQDNVVDIENLRTKASTLTSIAVTMAHRQRDMKVNTNSRWTVAAANSISWIPYANTSTVDMFLDRLFCLVSMNANTPEVAPNSMWGWASDAQVIGKEIAFAKSLLRDVSFLGQRRLQSRLQLSALSCTADWVAFALSFCTSGDSEVDKRLLAHAHTVHRGSGERSRQGSAELERLSQQTTTLMEDSRDDVSVRFEAALSNASRLLNVVNGLHVKIDSLDGSLDYIDAAFQLDHVCRSLATVNSKVNADAIQVSGALRQAVAKVMKPLTLSDLSPVFSSLQQLVTHVQAIVASAMTMTGDNGLEEEGTVAAVRGLVIGSRCLVSQLLRVAMSHDGDQEAIVLAIQSLHKKYRGPSDSTRIFLMVTKPFISLLRCYARSSWLNHLSSERRGLLWKPPTKDLTPSSLNDFYFDLVPLMCHSDSSDSHLSQEAERISMVFCSAIANAIEKEGSSSDERSFTFHIRLLAATLANLLPLGDELVQCIARFVAMGKNPDPLVESAYCRAVQRMPTIATVAWVEASLLDFPGDSAKAARSMQILLLFLRHVPSEQQTSEMTNLCPKILRVALSHLHPALQDESASRAGVEACRLVEELIRSHHLLLALRERDLARILSHLSAVLGPNNIVAATHIEAKWLSTDLYVQCSLLFLALFHRYTKNLYSCVPSVVSVLHSFLFRVLYDDDQVSHNDVQVRGQAFARMCEPLIDHKDIYKKHLVGLVVEFVRALQKNLHLVRKDAVMPAIYHVLDSLTSYEIKQIGTFIDPRSKPLLRTVFDLHQKHHSYKGQ